MRCPGLWFKENCELSELTSMKTGGTCRIFFRAATIRELTEVLRLLDEYGIKWVILGGGNNVIADDAGYDGAVIRLCGDFQKMSLMGMKIRAGSAVKMASLSSFASSHSVGDLSAIHGIPGSVGGGIYMNACAYGTMLSDLISTVEYIDENLEKRTISVEDAEFSYRKSIFQRKKWIITGAYFNLEYADKDEVIRKTKEYDEKRRNSQPLEFPSAGSVFKRPEGYFAGALIEKNGLKGKSVGGAQVSEKHAGFIINKGGATSADVFNLIDFIRETVYAADGVMLEPEVRVLNEQGITEWKR